MDTKNNLPQYFEQVKFKPEHQVGNNKDKVFLVIDSCGEEIRILEDFDFWPGEVRQCAIWHPRSRFITVE